MLRTVDAAALKGHRVEPPPGASGRADAVGPGRTWTASRSSSPTRRRARRCHRGRWARSGSAGPSVTQGYWNRPEQTAAGLRREVPGDGGRYLRTGDLGLLDRGDAVVTGRLKDLLIITGATAIPRTSKRSSVTFIPRSPGPPGWLSRSMPVKQEQILVIQEVRTALLDGASLAEVTSLIKVAVSRHFDVPAPDVVLVDRRGVHRTTSGKVQRRSMRTSFLENRIHPLLHQKHAPQPCNGCAAPRKRSTLHSPPEPRGVPPCPPQSPPPPPPLSRRSRAGSSNGSPATSTSPPGHGSDDASRRDRDRFGIRTEPVRRGRGEVADSRGVRPGLRLPHDRGDLRRIPRGRATAGGGGIMTDIAIVGLELPLPQPNPEALWALLMDGADGITEIPAQRWRADDFYDPEGGPGRVNNRSGGFLSDADAYRPRVLRHPPTRGRGDGSTAATAAAGRLARVRERDARSARPGRLEHRRLRRCDGERMGEPAPERLREDHTPTRFRQRIFHDRGPGSPTSWTYGARAWRSTPACSSSLVAVHMACTALQPRCDQALTECQGQQPTRPPFNIFYAQRLSTQTGTANRSANTNSINLDKVLP